MDKFWHQQYDKGVPAEVSTAPYNSLNDYLDIKFNQYAKFPAFENMGIVLTYAEVDEKSKQFASYLKNDLGLEKGDRFAIMLPNLLQYIIAMFGAIRAGLIVVNVNPLYTTRELAHQLKDSGAKGLLVLANFANVVEKAIVTSDIEHVILTNLGDAFSPLKSRIVNFVVKHVKKLVPDFNLPKAIKYADIFKKKYSNDFKPVQNSLEDTAFLQYTGGTTGLAKGAILTHKNMLTNIMQVHAWIAPYLSEDKKEIILTSLPLYHIFSLTANCWTFINGGAKNILVTNPRDIPSFVKEIEKSNCTITSGVNTLFNALLHNKKFLKLDFSQLHFVISGGMALQQVVSEKWKEVTGVNITEGYGLTEASPVVSVTPLSWDKFSGNIGVPVPSTECAIMNDDGEVPYGKEGELCVRGPQVMKGYWNKPEATDKVISSGGWLHTGDIAIMDENGIIKIVDRKKNMIVVSGFNVYPNEIEEVVSHMMGVSEAAAIGIDDERSGERIKLFVVKDDENLTKEDIINFCYQQLTRYKVPKDIEFREELPKSNVGKILHRKLRDEHDHTAS